MKIRFQADADLNEDIISGLLRREPRIDFRTATAANLRGLSDPEVLAAAAAEARILVSHDRKTLPHKFAAFIRTQTSPGVFIISQKTDLLLAIEGLLLAWAASEAEEWTNRICTIPL
ncbi:MAG: DUF5615 family PIN-like protein [Acidobacteriia bacterium]|nr:DUF5615 family PIN-like protein [Terriglobia bacterium]